MLNWCDYYRLTKNVMVSTRAKVLFIATDQNPMINELKQHLASLKVGLKTYPSALYQLSPKWFLSRLCLTIFHKQ